ncbi:hypothetical protein LJB98_02175 [Bacteroidales bacterium OttesenSCG-928-M11]|nr:hypothetical protein [Bacteroidales bacterium OttesenSCG-928-M11]
MKRLLLIITLSVSFSFAYPLYSQSNKDKPLIEKNQLPEMKVVDNMLYVSNAEKGSYLEIITIVGNTVQKIEAKTPAFGYDLNGLSKGIYIFKMGEVVRKFVVK